MTLSLLALDASTDTVHLALSVDEAVYVRALPAGAQASAVLLPAVQALLAEAQLALTSLDAVAFGRGPGAFTGLRTAAAIAQGLACGIDRPVLALDTLALVAESAHRGGAPTDCVWAAIDARMGEIYAAPWQRQADGSWRALAEVLLYSPTTLADRLASAAEPRPAALAGNAWLHHAAALDELLGPDHPATGLGRWPQAAPDGAALAALAQAAWRADRMIDPALALPLYVRDKVAQTTAERLAARQAAEKDRA